MQIRDALDHFHDRALELAGSFVFDKRVQLDRHRLALYGSMIEFVGAILILIDSKRFAGVPSMFRSFLESAVELENLMRDEGYVANMEAAHAEQWLKVLREAKTGANPYQAALTGMPDLEQQIAQHETELRRLRDQGRAPLSVLERFQRANMEEEYRSLYNFLSCDAHSNIRALMSRHIDINATEDDFHVCYYKDEPLESFQATLDSTAGLLLNASRHLHDSYNTGKLQEVDNLLEELKAVRGDYGA